MHNITNVGVLSLAKVMGLYGAVMGVVIALPYVGIGVLISAVSSSISSFSSLSCAIVSRLWRRRPATALGAARRPLAVRSNHSSAWWSRAAALPPLSPMPSKESSPSSLNSGTKPSNPDETLRAMFLNLVR